jgi:hypothetical protein
MREVQPALLIREENTWIKVDENQVISFINNYGPTLASWIDKIGDNGHFICNDSGLALYSGSPIVFNACKIVLKKIREPRLVVAYSFLRSLIYSKLLSRKFVLEILDLPLMEVHVHGVENLQQTIVLHAHCFDIICSSYRAKLGLYLDRSSFCTAPLQASITSFLLATVSPAPSPAPRMSNKVSYFHKERWQPQVYGRPSVIKF